MNCIFILFYLKVLFLDTRVLNIYIFPTKCIYCIFFNSFFNVDRLGYFYYCSSSLICKPKGLF